MGKTGDLFKKIRVTKGTFHEKMGTIKDRNDMDLTEAIDIQKTKIMASGPITSWQIMGKQWKQ